MCGRQAATWRITMYLPPFEGCVRDAKAGSVMCAYNSVTGMPACASRYLLQDVLRDRWGFDAGPAPRPNKKLVAYASLEQRPGRQCADAEFEVSIADLARSDEDGDRYIYPGDYTVARDTKAIITASFKLTGQVARISSLPRKS
ncbi:Glycoside hydrolase, family 3 [Cordyceps fumosorosea ARSEF 2679]|uniref:xylan 1,4-beta-xylosidase n=1 Tax=Cordyceps fumosorosea (strain ARSEF 2679) TaxID=1081104 RepID=A0A167V797_CORFA|nr:Glycoside hydrolase, family 3 [Cordyceps fumosorosea ARSEF 2679]OAA62301.1 Glycoside hydrolase, family 3 [Cordyceps fumosorosea ARSEF 2679]